MSPSPSEVTPQSFYKPLGVSEYRLLRLLPAQRFEAALECELFISRLDSGDLYEAISYAWGQATDTRDINVNGSKRQVTRNLELALRYLRLPDNPRILWADAICINQLDDVEKAQ